MPKVISNDYVGYKKPVTVNVGDRQYKSIIGVDTRHYTDTPDSVVKSVSYLNSKDAEYSVYVEDGRVIRSTKNYNTPVSRELGGKRYDNIHSKVSFPDGSRVYEAINPKTNAINQIKVTPEGEVIDYAAEARKELISKLKKPFVKGLELLKKVRV